MTTARRHAPALLCYALALAQLGLGLGCQDSIRGSGSGASSTVAGVLGTQDIGVVVFNVYRGQVAAEPDVSRRTARLAALDARRADFVEAINDIINVRTVGNAGQTADALFALIDDDTLPTLAEHLATTMDQLRGDAQALDAIVQLLQQRPGNGHQAIPPSELIELLGRMANYPDTEALWVAVARLIEENDGRDAQGRPNGEPTLVPDLLAAGRDALGRVSTATSPSATQGKLLDAFAEIGGAMTEEATVRGTFDFGPPEWFVRLDARGLPRVAVDPATGRLYAPFVDADQDGLADADAQGRFLDVAGAPIAQPTFGKPGTTGFDQDGRAVAGSGLPLFVYADAKRTIFALTAKLGGDLLARQVDEKGRLVLEAALGPLQADGTYGRQNAVTDLAWGALELADDEATGKLLRSAQSLLQRDPAGGERLLVALARAHEAARRAQPNGSLSTARLSDPRVAQLIDDFMPIVDDLLEQPSAGGRSTGQVLVETLASFRTVAPDFGPQLAPLFTHRRVERESAPDADKNGIDEARSTPVDYALPPLATGVDNRSAIHQLLDLLARNDACQLFGKSMAVWIIDMMAGLSPQTVGTLAGLVTALPGFLTNLLCPGTSNDIQALDSLARAGALDGFLPLAKAFKDRGETELLVRILVRMQRSYASTFRDIERDAAAILDAGVLEELEQALAVAMTVRDPLTGEVATDTMIGAVGDLVDVDAVVQDRAGRRVLTRAHLVLLPLMELDRRVAAAGRTAELSAIADAVFDVSFAREVVNGQELLKNGSLIPLTARALDAFVRALPGDAATRAAEVDLAQAQVIDALATKDFATLLALLRTIDASPHKATIRRSIVNLLTPNRAAQHDIFGSVMRFTVIGLSMPHGSIGLGPVQALAPFLARVIDPSNPLVPDALRAFERLITADQGKTVLNLLRAALNPAPGQTEPPAAILLDIIQQVQAAGGGGGGGSGGAFSRAQLEDALRRGAAFIRDDQAGLGYIFAMIKGRQRTP